MQKLIAELEKYLRNFSEPDCPRMQDGLIQQAAAALREDAKTIAELTAENERLKFPVTKQEFVTRMAELHELGGFIKSFENMERESEIVQRAIEFQSRLRAKLAEAEEANARLRKVIEEADFHPEYCSVVFKEPCDCGFDEWKRNALKEKP